ncbi:MAG: DUF4349 domain-containing protein [Oscillospiraceae bacterium]|nr:DUF4349 domain-containing protein [Oscillospiraceae bacterium]
MIEKMRVLLGLALMIFMIFLTGCSQEMVDTEYYAYSADSFSEGEEDGTAEDDKALEENFDRKIIQDASLEIKAENSLVLYKDLADYAKGLGGYEFSFDKTYHDDVEATLKIPPGKLDDFMSFAGEWGKIVSSSMSSRDISDSYYDAQTRLRTKREALQTYYKLLEKAETVEEIVTLQETIDKITEDIESWEGKLKKWNSQLDMATVSLLIRQDNDPLEIKKEINWDMLTWDDMGYLIKGGFTSIVNVIVAGFQMLVIALLAGSPIWVFAALVLWIVLRRLKKHKARKQNEDSEKDPE